MPKEEIVMDDEIEIHVHVVYAEIIMLRHFVVFVF